MAGTVMISLIGEQPSPNLLAVRYLKPDHVVLVYTKRTDEVSNRLCPLIGPCHERLQVEPYDITQVQQVLEARIAEAGWLGSSLTFNLTGGTKPMLMAAYRVAERLGSPFVYLQTEGGRSLLYRYWFAGHELRQDVPEEIPAVISLDEYLRVHLGDYQEGYQPTKPPNPAEQIVAAALQPTVDEIKVSVRHGGSLELDLALRCENQVGIAEVKTGRVSEGKSGIDQLQAATEQRYLGTYTVKFLILDRPPHKNNAELAKAYNITVIPLPSLTQGGLTEEDRKTLVQTVRRGLGEER